ncbi:MAG TPA: DUF1273 domain-containing protein [Firmicutes bacterium]|nr:DUF1273 domain-containing protein [Bacillota bacterium]
MPPIDSPLWNRARTCCFTGHRPDRLPSGYRQDPAACAPLRAALREAVLRAVREGYDTFLSGMALGSDTMAAQEVLALRSLGRPLRLIAVVPCPEQDARWPDADRERYRSLLEQADDRVCLSPRYTAACMHQRNRWMVLHSSRVIAVYGGGPGGTAGTLRLAEKEGLEIVRIDPFRPGAFAL